MIPLNKRDKDQLGESCHDPGKQEACGQFDHGHAMPSSEMQIKCLELVLALTGVLGLFL